MEGITTRVATPADAGAIAAIYNEGIADRIATFETEPRTAQQIAAQLVEKGDRFPTILAERAGRVGAGASKRRRPGAAWLQPAERAGLDRVHEHVPLGLLQRDDVLVLADANRVAVDDDFRARGALRAERDPFHGWSPPFASMC